MSEPENNKSSVTSDDLTDKSIKDAVENRVSSFKDKIVKQLTGENAVPFTPAEEKISNNAKIILLALFVMVSFIVGLGSWVIIAKPDVSTEIMTIIFSSAITGAFTLGGVLINAIWGK